MRKYAAILFCFVIFLALIAVAAEGSGSSDDKATNSESAKAEVESKAAESQEGGETTAVDAVVVTVNGVEIKDSELEEVVAPQLAQMARRSGQMPEAFMAQYKERMKQQAVDGLIIRRLMDDKVEAENISVSEQDIDKQISEIAAQQNLTMDDFKALLDAYGTSIDDIKVQLRKSLKYKKLMEGYFEGKFNISEADAKKYYDENRGQYETPEQIAASHILIKPEEDPNGDPNDLKAAAKAKTEDLLKQVKAGGDFAELAKANSQCPSSAKGGDLGTFAKGSMVPPFEEAAFALKVGQVSDVVETRFGYHIIKLTDHKEAKVDSFDDVKEDITQMLTGKEQEKLAGEYIGKLKESATIVYAPGREPKAPMRPQFAPPMRPSK